ncbi:hypothetical protein C8Q72DRAFT_879888 [Fomitopsis betulina]|nr:hypothetical protein C8Q72DRAFT_879888 [Fomitopsis betulina]
MDTEHLFFQPILLSAESAPLYDVKRFCRLLSHYARRDTESGAKRFHWPSYKKAIDRHTLSDVSYTSYTTAHAEAPATSVQAIATHVADVLAGQIEPEVDVYQLAGILEERLFDFESASNERWASFLPLAAGRGMLSGWELRAVVLPPQAAASPTDDFTCIVTTIRIEGAVGRHQGSWVRLGSRKVEEPDITVDVMHCSVLKSLEQREAGMRFTSILSLQAYLIY